MLNIKNMELVKIIEAMLKEMGLHYQNENDEIYIGFQDSDKNIRFATKISIDEDSNVFLVTSIETPNLGKDVIVNSIFKKYESVLYSSLIKRDYCNFALAFKSEHTLFMLPYALKCVIREIVSDLTD